MRYLAGIDGGQSGTGAALLDETGRVLARGSAGPADHVDEPPGSDRCAAACAAALAAAVAAAGLPAGTRCAAVVAGISGYDEDFDGAEPVLPADRFRVVHDAPIALAGALQTRPAVLLLSGTGSVAYGEDASGRGVRVGGWGYLFGDEGSAFAIARAALAAAMHAADRGERTLLGTQALEFFAVADLRALAAAQLRGRIARPALASFAPLVHTAAAAGDRDGLRIVADAADALASLAAVALAQLGPVTEPMPVALSGGSFSASAFAELVAARLHAHAPRAGVEPARYDAAVGAALLAFDDAGLARPAAVIE